MGKSVTTNRLASDLDNILSRTEPLWRDLRGERILITGATGFFGCWLLESFAWANDRLNLDACVVGLSRNPSTLTQKAPHLARNPAITLHAADVRTGDFPPGKFSHVIHAATEASARLNREAPMEMFETIVEGTRHTLQFSVDVSTARFLLVSSGAVYGTQPPQLTRVSESFTGGPDPLDPANSYAEGKRAAELLCSLAASPSFAATAARCFAFVGPGMPLDTHFAIGNFIGDRLRSRAICVQGDGTAVRSYLYASDLMVWLWTILFKGQSRRAYNVGSEEAIDIASLAREVATALPPEVAVNVASTATPGAVVHRYVPSTARAREELGLTAEVSLREAIRRTYRWFSEGAIAGDGFSDAEISKAEAITRGAHA
ncbi:MAG TPA: NAD(P)-dependent oxidoreductase [Terriglobales bacterium]|jgi:nucleoside-diphosphate-sugar epimerase|nr:NAD(P)-dependent oxidoreductase [Terriglobales bacterium]